MLAKLVSFLSQNLHPNGVALRNGRRKCGWLRIESHVISTTENTICCESQKKTKINSINNLLRDSNAILLRRRTHFRLLNNIKKVFTSILSRRKTRLDSRVTAELSSMDPVRRDVRDRESAEEAEDGTDGEGSSESESNDGSDGESDGESVSVVRKFRGSKSSVYNHLVASPGCCNSYSDSLFTVLCRGRNGYGLQLKVLEAICQRLYKPNLCVQKDSIIGLKLLK